MCEHAANFSLPRKSVTHVLGKGFLFFLPSHFSLLERWVERGGEEESAACFLTSFHLTPPLPLLHIFGKSIRQKGSSCKNSQTVFPFYMEPLMAWIIRTVCVAMSASSHPQVDACEILKVNSIFPKKDSPGRKCCFQLCTSAKLIPNFPAHILTEREKGEK